MLFRSIPFSNLESSLKDSLFVKHWSLSDSKYIRDKFDHEIFTYFPAYRYEIPSYLNDPYKIELKFNLNNDFAGYLTNPIEVTSDIQKMLTGAWMLYLMSVYKKFLRKLYFSSSVLC